MIDKNKRYLITSALPYINGVKHLGNLVGSLLPADVYARFLRQQGCDVLFICATDEHGTPAELGAAAAGLSTAEYCDNEHERQAKIYKEFKLSFDHFGRTSRPQNIELTQYFAKKLSDAGYIKEETIKQLYSKADDRFLPDRYVEGTCPHCGYEKARGDQCESCTAELEPTELVNPRSAVSGSTDLELRESKHLFLELSKLTDTIAPWLAAKNNWPVLVKSIANKWLKEGLRDRCITRDLKWGVPVNREGFEDKVFYVWFDAPIGYISATKEWADIEPEKRDWKSWWFESKDVWYTQFMAKDNVPFHTLSFPATQLATGEEWKTVDYIKGFSWLTYYGGKFSTSQKRGVFTSDALELFPSDYWRYYLMARAPESSDSAFTWPDFQAVVNKDLADVLGNYINRSLKLCEKHFGKNIPESSAHTDLEKHFVSSLSEHFTNYTKHLSRNEYRKAANELRAIWSAGNEYLAEAAPWTAIKTDRERAGGVLNIAINFIRIIATLSAPLLPDTAKTLANAISVTDFDKGWISDDIKAELCKLPAGHAFEIPPVLFKKIDDKEIATFEERFGAGS